MLKIHFKIAWRNITSHKTSSLINVLGLALGIASCLVIYLIAHFELSYDNFHPGKENIYRIVTDMNTSRGQDHASNIPDPAPAAIRKELAGMEEQAIFHNYFASVTIREGSTVPKRFPVPDLRENSSDIIIVEPAYFDIFQYRWLAGNPTTALNEPFKVVLTESKARTYFGRGPLQDMIKKTIVYNDSLTVAVSGIVEDFPVNTDFYFNDFISFPTASHSFLKNESGSEDWNSGNMAHQVFVKLRENTTAASVDARLADLVQRRLPDGANQKTRFRLQPLSEIHFDSNYRDGYSGKAHLPTLYALMGIAVFILILAVINFINLSTAQSLRRAKEIAIRKICGSNRISLMLQLLGETFLLVLGATCFSVIAAPFLLGAFRSYIPKEVSLDLFSGQTWICLLSIIVFTTLFAGLYPARLISSSQPVKHLKGSPMQAGYSHGWLRKGLVVFQFTISLLFIIGSIVMNNQIRFILNKDLGFTKEAILTIGTNPFYPPAKKDLLAAKIRQLAGVALVSVSDGPPIAKDHWLLPLWYQQKKVDCKFEWADANYVPLYQLKLVAGRNLLRSDTMKEILINENCARVLGFKRPEDALGQQVRTIVPEGERSCPIVGVLADFHASELHAPIQPAFIASSDQFSPNVNVKLSMQGRQISQLSMLLSQMGAIWKEFYPDDKFEYQFFDQQIAKLYEKDLQTARLMNWAMGLAIFISCMGLLGLSVFIARQRTREIGIRKVLGASITGITAMLCKDFVRLVIVSFFIACPIAWYFMNRWLQSFAYRNEINAWVFILAGSGVVFISLITVSLQAIRAAAADPVSSLRSE